MLAVQPKYHYEPVGPCRLSCMFHKARYLFFGIALPVLCMYVVPRKSEQGTQYTVVLLGLA